VPTKRPEIEGWFGVAASSHWLASQTAMRILELDGNAFDAAVAGGFVLQVTAPHLNGPAGDLALLYHDGPRGETKAVCGQGPVPAAATIDRFRAMDLDAVPGTGLLPAVVPGAFDAWLTILLEKGTLSLRTILDSAIFYAERGIPVSQRMHDILSAAFPLFRQYWPSSAAVFAPCGRPPPVGAAFANPALAATWRRMLQEAERVGGSRSRQIEAARRAWSDGFVADAIDRFCATTSVMDITGASHRAFLTGEDLAGWRAKTEVPVEMAYGQHRIAKCGPWSQGPVMLQTLSLLPPDEIAGLDPMGTEFVHLTVEAMKLAYADRDTFYGDPDHVDVALDDLLSEPYTQARRGLIGDHADLGWRPGRPTAGPPPWTLDYQAAASRVRDASLLGAYGGGEPTIEAGNGEAEDDGGDYLKAVSGDTCHIDVIDRHGNIVSATPSGGWLQSSPAIAELGFPLGTRGQMTWLDPRSPTALTPKRRPRTTLTPTIVLHEDGQGCLACGTPGGDQQDQWQAVFLLRHLVHGLGLQEAIEAPAFHSEHWPNSFYPRAASPGRLVVEDRFPQSVQDGLVSRGHKVEAGDGWSEGRLTAASRGIEGRMRAAASPRDATSYAVGR